MDVSLLQLGLKFSFVVKRSLLLFLLCGSALWSPVLFAADPGVGSIESTGVSTKTNGAQDLPATQSQSLHPDAPEPSKIDAADESASVQTRKPKGRTPREKEAEGTQAPNRFGADTIIKSKYQLDGQSLEVDTE